MIRMRSVSPLPEALMAGSEGETQNFNARIENHLNEIGVRIPPRFWIFT